MAVTITDHLIFEDLIHNSDVFFALIRNPVLYERVLKTRDEIRRRRANVLSPDVD